MNFPGTNAYEKFRGKTSGQGIGDLFPAWKNLFIQGINWQDLWYIFAQGLHKRRLGKMFGQDPYKSFLGKIFARIDCNERSLKKIVALFIGSLYNITITGLLAEFFAQKFCKNSVGKISESRLFATF
jgi:hypothetical protein